MNPILKIIIGWIIFPFSFTGWYLDCKYHGTSNGLIEDYIFWHKLEYEDMKKTSQSHREAK